MAKLFEVGDDVLTNVAESFGRSVQSLNEDVKTVQEWIKTQPHLPEIMDDKKIQNFLILNKCSIEKTKTKIERYYTVRSHLSELYARSNPKSPAMRKIAEAMYMVPLPKLTEEMCRIIVFKARNPKLTAEIDPFDTLTYLSNIFELRISEDVAFMDIIIADTKDISVKFFLKFTPTYIYNFFITVYQKVYSSRFKAMYIINAPPIMETVMAICKAVMKPKLFERLKVSKDSSILNQFPKEILPKELGGDEITFEEIQELVDSKFDEYQKRFDALDELRVDESLRPEKLENDEFLGFHGNFKKLEID